MSRVSEIALVGSRGFVGRAVAAAAAEQGLNVLPINLRVDSGFPPDLSAVESVELWISQHAETYERLVGQLSSVEVVVNAAGLAAPESNWERDLFAANVVLPGVIARAAQAARARRLVHVSSAAVQGRRDPLNETDEIEPITPYGRSKAAAESLLTGGELVVPEEVVIYRPTSVQAVDRQMTRTLVSLAGRGVLPVGGDGRRPIPLCLVENVAAGIVLAATADRYVPLVLQPSEGITARRLWELFGRQPRIVSIPRLPLKAGLALGAVLGRFSTGVAATVRRLDLLLLGQAQNAQALGKLGFAPPKGIDCYRELAEGMRGEAADTRVLHIAAVEYTLRRLVLPQLHTLAESGFEVIVACAPEEAEFNPSLQPFSPRALRFPRRFDPRELMRASVNLRRLIRELRPTVVHFHSPAASIPGRAALALPLRRRPLVVQTVHGFLSQKEQTGRSAAAFRAAELQLSRFTDLSLFVSKEDLAEAETQKHRGLLRYLGNGVSDEWFADAVPRPARQGRLRAVFVGRVVREKGILDLLEAMKAAEGVELIVIGDQLPSERDGVMAEARALAAPLADRVRFTGMIEAPEIRDHFAEADLFVLPSMREGLPLSIIEALAAGLPVLATDIRGCRELVVPGSNGWLIPPRAPAELAGALNQAALMSQLELAAMGAASRKGAESYRVTQVTERLLKAYQELGVSYQA